MHGLQPSCPCSSWKVPASQAVHASARSEGLNVPGTHSVSFAEPTGQQLPAGHVMHIPALVITAWAVAVRARRTYPSNHPPQSFLLAISNLPIGPTPPDDPNEPTLNIAPFPSRTTTGVHRG